MEVHQAARGRLAYLGVANLAASTRMTGQLTWGRFDCAAGRVRGRPWTDDSHATRHHIVQTFVPTLQNWLEVRLEKEIGVQKGTLAIYFCSALTYIIAINGIGNMNVHHPRHLFPTPRYCSTDCGKTRHSQPVAIAIDWRLWLVIVVQELSRNASGEMRGQMWNLHRTVAVQDPNLQDGSHLITESWQKNIRILQWTMFICSFCFGPGSIDFYKYVHLVMNVSYTPACKTGMLFTSQENSGGKVVPVRNSPDTNHVGQSRWWFHKEVRVSTISTPHWYLHYQDLTTFNSSSNISENILSSGKNCKNSKHSALEQSASPSTEGSKKRGQDKRLSATLELYLKDKTHTVPGYRTSQSSEAKTTSMSSILDLQKRGSWSRIACDRCRKFDEFGVNHTERWWKSKFWGSG